MITEVSWTGVSNVRNAPNVTLYTDIDKATCLSIDGRGRSYLIVEGYSTEVEIITQAEAWLLLGRAAHTALPIP